VEGLGAMRFVPADMQRTEALVNARDRKRGSFRQRGGASLENPGRGACVGAARNGASRSSEWVGRAARSAVSMHRPKSESTRGRVCCDREDDDWRIPPPRTSRGDFPRLRKSEKARADEDGLIVPEPYPPPSCTMASAGHLPAPAGVGSRLLELMRPEAGVPQDSRVVPHGSHLHSKSGVSESNNETSWREESDSMGVVRVPANKYWGAQTQRSLQNFKIGGEKMPMEMLRALAIVKHVVATCQRDAREASRPELAEPLSRSPAREGD
jgi:fumarase (EC 4.2.1.2)